MKKIQLSMVAAVAIDDLNKRKAMSMRARQSGKTKMVDKTNELRLQSKDV